MVNASLSPMQTKKLLMVTRMARQLDWSLETAQLVASDPFWAADVSSGGNVMMEVLTRECER